MRKLIIVLFFTITAQVFAQISPNKYLVRFTDKDQSPYSLSQPGEFLTQRAIDRRNKQGLEVDITDIPIDPVYIQGVIATGAKLVIQVKWINAIIIEVESQTVLDAVNALSYVYSAEGINKRSSTYKSKLVDKFAEEETIPLKLIQTENDPVYGDAFNQIDMVNGIPLHESGFKGDGMVIAVLDAGFINANVRTIFSSLWDNNQILGSYNFVNPAEDVYRYNTHGTMVLSVMGGYLPDTFLGTAPEADYWLLLTEETGSEFLIEEYNWIAGAAFADSVGADVINSSLGYNEFDDAVYDHSYDDFDGNTIEVTKAADLAASKGIIVVNSAGNSGDDSWKYLIAPADGDSVFTIGAVDADGLITNFSSYGFESDSRVKPNIVAQGGGTVLANVDADVLRTGNGTSFSSPLIAGMMACLWQAIPDANNMDIIQAVEKSASQYSTPDNRYGYGIPDFNNARILLGISEQLLSKNSITISPNPISNISIVRWDQSNNNFKTIELLDIQGRVIYSDKLDKSSSFYRLSLGDYKSGIYFLRLSNGIQTQTEKIAKID